MKVLKIAALALALCLTAGGSAVAGKTERAGKPFRYEPKKEIPVDTEHMVKGQLANGLTYYIRHNETPKDKVELRMIVNAGSIQEDENQRGLAHFLEHMSFNGTRTWPNAEMIGMLESMGVRFGYELNAYTSFDETVYYLPIAADKIDVGLNVLQDWAAYLNLAEADIDRERGVILEEMRLGRSAGTRLREQYLPVLMAGSRYPERLPIGKAEVVSNFTYDELRAFYHDWYRPDLLAVIVVGDIDPAYVEEQIRERFSGMTAPATARPRIVSHVPDHDSLRVVVATDPETSGCSVEISYKHLPKKVVTQRDYVEQNIYDALYASMINARLAELAESDNPPFFDAESGYGAYFRGVSTYSSYARCSPDSVARALRTLATEDERVRRYGFTPGELERAKARMTARYERYYNEREKTASDLYVDEYQVNFLTGEPIPGIEYEYELVGAVLPKVKVADINKLADKYMTERNRTVVVTGPASRVYSSEDELRAIVEGVRTAEVAPYDEGEVVTELMDFTPEPGTIVSERTLPGLNLTEWKLSNGSTVVFMPTDFKNDEVLFRASSNGGYSMYGPDDDMSALYATAIQDESGVNGINNIQLKRLLAGKTMSLTQSLVLYNESMSGRFAPRDAQEFFELLYLYHTAPYFDSAAYVRVMQAERSEYAHLLDSPNNYFGYEVTKIMNNGNPRRSRWPVPENLDQVRFDRAQQIYKERFGNAAGFTYVFVGNVDPEAMKQLVLTYLGGIPGDAAAKPGYDEQEFTSPAGPAEYVFHKGSEQKANVTLRFVKPADWDKEMANAYSAFVEVLNTRLFESLRLDMSGVYGVSVNGSVNREHEREARLNIAFGTNPGSYEALYERTIAEVKKLMAEGPTTEELDKVKEKRRVALDASLRQNANWLLGIMYAYRYGVEPDSADEQRRLIEELTPGRVREAANAYVDPATVLKFVLLPDPDAEPAVME
ncbi:MAG: insulinase family protein [Rikenellaceae bacterium]|nr:insulinase family protein [Rikenellaceae bacterium]